MPIVNVRPDHLPADIAPLLTSYLELSREAAEARHRVTVAPMTARAGLQDEVNKADEAVGEALSELEKATRISNRQILDSSAGAFFAHVENARTALAQAEAEMRSAAHAAALHATAATHAGRPVLDTDTVVARDNPGRQRAMYVVSEVRDLLGALPDAID